VLCQLLFRRHFQFFVGVSKGGDDSAFAGFAWNQDGAVFSAFEHACFCIQQESATELFGIGAMATVAFLHQHGADVLFEMIPAGAFIIALKRGHGEIQEDERNDVAQGRHVYTDE
jgi:hypothetical protein